MAGEGPPRLSFFRYYQSIKNNDVYHWFKLLQAKKKKKKTTALWKDNSGATTPIDEVKPKTEKFWWYPTKYKHSRELSQLLNI